MDTIRNQIQSKELVKIKRIVDKDNNGNKFIILRTDKNVRFMREYDLEDKDVKDIVRKLSVEDCFAGPEEDRNPKYDGYIYKFSPVWEEEKLYIKIRIENKDKSVCLSIHKFGEYDEVR